MNAQAPGMATTWTVLVDKASAALHDTLTRLNEARQQVEKLEASAAHLERLRADYVARYHETQKVAHAIADNIAYRKFLEHLGGLSGRIEVQLQDAHLQVAAARAAVVLAQREVAKMEAMVERDQRERQQQAAKREQRLLDEAGLRPFHLR